MYVSTFDCPPLPLWKYDLHKCKCPSESLRDPPYFKNTLSAPALMCRFGRISVKSSESHCKSHFMRLYLHSFPLSVTKGANLRKEWIVKFILDAVFKKNYDDIVDTRLESVMGRQTGLWSPAVQLQKALSCLFQSHQVFMMVVMMIDRSI